MGVCTRNSDIKTINDRKRKMKLSPEQFAICTVAAKKNILVNAGPGCAKTTTIVHRMLRLHTEFKVPKTKMAYVTYNKKLGEEVKLTLKKNNLATLFHKGTIDSLCLHLLQKQAGQKLDVEQGKIVSICLEELEKGIDLAAHMSNVTHIFVDEAQDLDRTRFEILRRICVDKFMMIVGDPRQAIYQKLFGASPTFMTQLKPDAISLPLTISFRLSPSTVRFLNAAFKYPGLPNLRSFSEAETFASPKLTVMHADTEFAINRKETVQHVVTRCKQIISGGERPDSIAILSPTARNSTLALLNNLRTTLEHAGISTLFNKREAETGADSCGSVGKNSVYMGTVHSFKGSERDHVILLNAYVSPGAFTREDELRNLCADYMNVLFVGCSRHRKSLELMESCHYPIKNERIEFVRKAGKTIEHQVVRKKILGKTKFEKGIPSNSVTDLLKNLDEKALDDLLACVFTTAECVRAPICAYSAPSVFIEYNDCDLYGKFIEAVIARAIAENGRQDVYADVCKTLVTMPVYLTSAEYKALRSGKDAAISPDKFAHASITLSALSAIVKKGMEDSVTNSYEVMKILLRTRHSVCVCEESDLFYEVLSTTWERVDNIQDLGVKTEDLIGPIWDAVLLQHFHENALGVYWLPHWRMTAETLLPSGAESWGEYLKQVCVVFRTLGLVSYQQPLSAHELRGVADILTPKGEVVDIKACLKEDSVVALDNRAQVQCYRGMTGNKNKRALLFSAFTCALYELPAESEATDEAVLSALQAFRERKR